MALAVTAAGHALAQVTFVDVSDTAGFVDVGPTYGASWGDFDGDGYPDVWLSNHARQPALYRNNQDGTFTDIVPQVWPGRFLPADHECDILIPGVCLADTHGAAWVDFDNDGDQDLLEVVGGSRGNHFFENDSGEFFERAFLYGIHAMGARSRSTAWIDWNRDGRIDPVLTHTPNGTDQPLLMTNQINTFLNAGVETGIGEHSAVAAYLADLADDGLPELILSSGNLNSGPAFSTASVPFANVTDALAIPGTARRFGCADAVFEDFNGDLLTDVFSVCGGGGREVVERDDGRVEARITSVQEETAIEFDADTVLTVGVFPGFLLDLEENLRVGAASVIPEVVETPELGWQSFSMVLDPSNPQFHGTSPHTPGTDLGLFVSYDVAAGRWRLALSSPGGVGISLVANAVGGITNVTTDGFNPTPNASQPVYLLRNDGGFLDRRVAAGFNIPLACVSAVGGDFDNDGDVDVYAMCSRTINNLENRLFINDGTGVFTESGAGSDTRGSDLGSGDTVTTVDYDQDGFLDLFLTNGNGGAPFYNGPQQLLRNQGNDNHWLVLDLAGTTSNRDAIGAIVTITSGGTQQRRMQDGGFHRKAQDHDIVHFGLGDQTTVDEIIVSWPSGQQTILNDVAADQILSIVEMVDPDPDGDGVDASVDNCLTVANADQLDSNGDGYGNACDGDFNADCVVNVVDLGLFRVNFLSANAEYDLNGDGVVNVTDLGIFRTLFQLPVGPSAMTTVCDP